MPITVYAPRPLVTVSNLDFSHGIGIETTAFYSGLASTVWPSANRALLYPIYLTEPGVIVKFWNTNGATAAGNIDIGLYSSAFVRLVSIGATAQAGTSSNQVFDTTDYPVTPGRYYLAVAKDDTTGTCAATTGPGSYHLRAMGMVQMAAAYVLPATITPATVTSGFVHLCGFSYRVLTG